ncbi:LacI family DNA-binding transcriptional regulator [Pseudoalteromonas sp. YIC-656]|uniref:LacI family DNA-binding transcriptional regulator n=1 Tax=Pseudoalteromonas pernae TaxID=3118054 RepID=UPI003241E982
MHYKNMTHSPMYSKVTIIDVAQHAGVSKSTVSLVLSQPEKVSAKTKEKVHHSMTELGYVYNRDAASLRSKRSGLVAIILPFLDNPTFNDIANTLQQGIMQMGFVPMLLCSNDDVLTQQQLVNRLKESNVTAVLLCPAHNTDVNWQNALAQSGITVINILREVSLSEAPCVLADTKRGTFLATQAILDKGCNSVILLGGKPTMSGYSRIVEGFQQAAQLHERNANIHLIECANTRRASQEALSENTLLASKEGPIGIVCFSDIVAYGVLDMLTNYGLVAGVDAFIVGLGDFPDSKLLPCPLSSVAIRSQEIAEHTLNNLTALLNQQSVARRTLIDVTLIKRASCS